MAELVRAVDRIDTSPRFREADAVRLNRMSQGSDTHEMLEGLLRDRLAGDVAIVSSFGAESSVLLHLVAQVDPSIPVLFLETGKHFPETLAYRDALVGRLGPTDLRNLTPDPTALAAKDESGLRWSYDPDGCCEIRKVITENKVKAPAKAGAISSLDVDVPAQVTTMGPEKTSFFQALQIPTKITRGQIEIIVSFIIFYNHYFSGESLSNILIV